LDVRPIDTGRGGSLPPVWSVDGRPSSITRTVVTRVTSEGRRGVEPKPNRTGGSTGHMLPKSVPSQEAVSPVIDRTSRAAYHSRRAPVRPRVRTPRITVRAIGSTAAAHTVEVAIRNGTAPINRPSAVR